MKYLFILTLLSATFSSCWPEFGCNRRWKFEIPFTIENEQTSYVKGDTIWISSLLDKRLKDINSDDRLELPGFQDYEFMLSLIRIDTTPNAFVYDDITIIPTIGKSTFVPFYVEGFTGVSGYYHIEFIDEGANWHIKLRVVVDIKGTFMLESAVIPHWDRDKPVALTEDCKDYLSDFRVIFEGDSDKGFDMYINSPISGRIIEDKFEYLNDGIFTFQVVE